MHNRNARKLSLNKETLRNLQESELARVLGGGAPAAALQARTAGCIVTGGPSDSCPYPPYAEYAGVVGSVDPVPGEDPVTEQG